MILTTAEKTKSQSDFDHLVSPSFKWQIKFNLSKCKVLHMASNIDHSNYSMNGSDQTLTKKKISTSE